MPIFSNFPPAFHPRRCGRALVLGISACVLFARPALANTIEEADQSLKAGQHAVALKQVDRYLAGKPKDAQGRFLKGVILAGLNKQNDAIAVFKKLTEDHPELPEPYNNLAVLYAQQKQYDKAKEALEKAIRTHPAYATAHDNLGHLYSRLASQAYGKALQIDPANAAEQTRLAMIDGLGGGGKVGAGKTAPAGTVPAAAPAAPAATVVAAAKPAEPAKPAPAPAAAATKTAPAKAEPAKPTDAAAEVTAAIDGWLAAWSKKNVKAYLAYYARDFQPPNNQARNEWESERAQRVGKPGKIEVGRDKLGIKIEGDDKAVVRFRQNYKSAGFNSSSGKTLVLVKRDGKWLIQQERVGG